MGTNESAEARRKRQKRHRQRLAEAGMTTVTVTVPKDRAQDIKDLAARMVAEAKADKRSQSD
jgi:hypothetical protein